MSLHDEINPEYFEAWRRGEDAYADDGRTICPESGTPVGYGLAGPGEDPPEPPEQDDRPFEVLTAEALRKARAEAHGALADLYDFLRTVQHDQAFAGLVAQHVGTHEDDVAARSLLLVAADCRAELDTLFGLSLHPEIVSAWPPPANGPVLDRDGREVPTLSELLDDEGEADEAIRQADREMREAAGQALGDDDSDDEEPCIGCGENTRGAADPRCQDHLCRACWARVRTDRYGS